MWKAFPNLASKSTTMRETAVVRVVDVTVDANCWFDDDGEEDFADAAIICCTFELLLRIEEPRCGTGGAPPPLFVVFAVGV